MSGTECSMDTADGVSIVELSSWEEFHKEVTNLTANAEYVWRGQKEDKPPKSSFDRDFENSDKNGRSKMLRQHLKHFKEEMNQSHPHVLPKNEDDMWALGQHYGLRTPLLDWTQSPYIAAYFAFEEAVDLDVHDDKYRYVYALNKSLRRLQAKFKNKPNKRFVPFIESLKQPNPRFLSQKCIFTNALNGDDIETNVKRWSKKRPNETLLVKFKIPTKDRDRCLHTLHLMSIDYESLLLDLRGVVDKCNNELRDCHRASEIVTTS